MTALIPYQTGTVSVAADGTTVVGVGMIWNDGSVKAGDRFDVGHVSALIVEVVDPTHLTITPWPGATLSGANYKIWPNYPARVQGVEVLATVNRVAAVLDDRRVPVIVGDAETVPDPSLGEEGQTAIQPSTGKVWAMSGGVWVYQGIFKALNPRGDYDNAATYSYGDWQTTSGSSYVYINNTPSSGHAAPNPTYWKLLADKGGQGNPGATGAGYGGTSTTPITIGTGARVFATQAGLAYTNGARVRASSTANTSNWVEGLATYSGTTLTITADKTSGSGTPTSWNFNAVGQPGAGDMTAANNLSEVNPAQARANLGIDIVSQGRITLTSGAPVSGSVSGAAQFYFTPYNGNLICIYDGTKFVPVAFSEVSQANTDTTKSPTAVAASKNYDLFAWLDGSTFRVTRGPAWTGDNARGSGAGTSELTRVNGLLVNAQAITNGPAAQRGTYVGTVRSNAASTLDFYWGGSAAGGSAAKLMVWNMYNRVDASGASTDTTLSYTTSSATRQANGSAENQCSFVVGQIEDSFSASYTGRAQTAATAGATAGLGLGINTSSVLTVSQPATTAANVAVSFGMAPSFHGPPLLGYNFIAAMEFTSGVTSTFNGAGNNTISTKIRM